jgi:hypothetical protein
MNGVLIVEDDRLIAGDIGATLKRLGHGWIRDVHRGDAALRREGA